MKLIFHKGCNTTNHQQEVKALRHIWDLKFDKCSIQTRRDPGEPRVPPSIPVVIFHDFFRPGGGGGHGPLAPRIRYCIPTLSGGSHWLREVTWLSGGDWRSPSSVTPWSPPCPTCREALIGLETRKRSLRRETGPLLSHPSSVPPPQSPPCPAYPEALIWLRESSQDKEGIEKGTESVEASKFVLTCNSNRPAQAIWPSTEGQKKTNSKCKQTIAYCPIFKLLVILGKLLWFQQNNKLLVIFKNSIWPS